MPNPVNNKSSANLVSFGKGSEYFETRNEVLPNPASMQRELLDVLEYYLTNSDVDASPLEIGQTNSQKEVVKNIAAAVARENYPSAQAILFREDIKLTPQMEEIALRLNRLVQVGTRQGTTDNLEFAKAKSEIINHPELMDFYNGERGEAELILANVSEALSGTREMGIEELTEAREMVRKALQASFSGNYATGLAPHKLEGQEQGAKFINRDQNSQQVEYLRLFDALTLEIMRQREISQSGSKKIILERELTMGLLSGLAGLPGVDFNYDLKQEFLKKVAVMDLNQLLYFNHTIERLKRDVAQNGAGNEGSANKEIQHWLKKDFTPAELHRELEEMKNVNEQQRKSDLEILRGHLKQQPITKPIKRPVTPGEYFQKAA